MNNSIEIIQQILRCKYMANPNKTINTLFISKNLLDVLKEQIKCDIIVDEPLVKNAICGMKFYTVLEDDVIEVV